MKTAVIYARYSSDSQTEQSIEGQLRVCNDFAERNNINILNTYIDRAMTGTNDNRPDFQQMIRDSNKKLWDYVIVYKLDRFSRNKYEATIHKHTLNNNGVKLLSAMENIPDTPEGIILESLLEGMNQYYSAELSQKVKRGLNESYLKGQYTGGAQLYGYRVQDKHNVIDEEESKIVKEIFTKYSQGYTGVDIAKDLQNRGVITKQGTFISEKRIYKMIANIKYSGKVVHDNVVYTNIYPPIIDEITWQKVQKIRMLYKHKDISKKDNYGYLLSGKVFCGYCKRNMIGEAGNELNHIKKYRYYNCLTKRRLRKPCEMKFKRKHELEKEVIDLTWKVLSNNGNLRTIAKNIIKYKTLIDDDCYKVNVLEKNKEDLLKSSNNLIAAIEKGIVTEQTKLRLKEIETRIKEIDIAIEQEKQKSLMYLTEDMIMNFFKKVICGDIENNEVQKQIIKTFIREIIVYNDAIVILYNYTDMQYLTTVPPDDIKEFDLDKLKSKLLNEREINKNMDVTIFYSKEYFAAMKKINN